MIRLAIAIVLAFLAARVASAQSTATTLETDVKRPSIGTRTELFYQASEGDFIVTPGYEYSNESGALKNDDRQLQDTGRISKLKLEYGWSESLSTAVQFKYKDGSLNEDLGYEVESEGLQDVDIDFYGSMPLEAPTATLHYGAFVRHSIERTQVVTVDTEFNGSTVVATPISQDAHSGGTSLTPYLGYSKVVGSYVLGARFLQTIWGAERKKKIEINRDKLPGPVKSIPQVQDRESTEEGGGATELKVFAERNFGNATLNVSSKFRHTSPEKETSSAGTQTVQDELDMLSLEIAPRYRVNSSFDLVGGLGYTKLLNQNIIYQGEIVETGELYWMNLGGRVTF